MLHGYVINIISSMQRLIMSIDSCVVVYVSSVPDSFIDRDQYEIHSMVIMDPCTFICLL